MIAVHYFALPGFHKLRVSGHAHFDEMGRDIVCAGVSAISYALMNYLEEHRKSFDRLQISAEAGHVEIVCKGKGIGIAFDVAMAGYQAIAQTYPDHVTVYTPQMAADSREKTAGKEHGNHAEKRIAQTEPATV